MKSRPRLVVIPDELRRQRLKALLSQPELAKAADLSLRTIKDLEAGQSDSVQPRTIRKLSEALACKADLFSRVDDVEVAAS